MKITSKLCFAKDLQRKLFQVLAERDIHNLINGWDSMTRTERRTRATIQNVVGTVEMSMELIAISKTDAIPMAKQAEGGGDDEDGDGDGDDS